MISPHPIGDLVDEISQLRQTITYCEGQILRKQAEMLKILADKLKPEPVAPVGRRHTEESKAKMRLAMNKRLAKRNGRSFHFATVILLTALLAVAQNPMIPPAITPAKKYHTITVSKGATLLRTAPLVVAKPKMLLLTWQPNYTAPNEVTGIEASPDLKNWTRIFLGATNQCLVPASDHFGYFRAFNTVTNQ